MQMAPSKDRQPLTPWIVLSCVLGWIVFVLTNHNALLAPDTCPLHVLGSCVGPKVVKNVFFPKLPLDHLGCSNKWFKAIWSHL